MGRRVGVGITLIILNDYENLKENIFLLKTSILRKNERDFM
jgi:hypothetical protein